MHEVALAQRQNFAAHEPRIARPADQAKRENHVIEARTEHRGKGNGQENPGKGHQNIDQAHEPMIDPTAEITRERADQKTDAERQGYSGHPDQQRDAGAVNRAAQNVAAQFVGAERVLAGIGDQVFVEILAQRIVRRDQRREQRR